MPSFLPSFVFNNISGCTFIFEVQETGAGRQEAEFRTPGSPLSPNVTSASGPLNSCVEIATSESLGVGWSGRMRIGNEKVKVGGGIHESNSLERGRIASNAAPFFHYKHMTRLLSSTN